MIQITFRSLSDHFPDFPMGIGTLDSLAGHFMNISGALLCEQCPMGSFGGLWRRALGMADGAWMMRSWFFFAKEV